MRRRRRVPGGAALRTDRGSMAVEFVFVAPLLLILMLFLVYAGRVVEVHNQVDGAARDAARAASLARTRAAARADELQAVSQDVPACANPADVSQPIGWTVAGTQPVSVSITCRLDMGFLGFGFGTVPVHGFAAAPMDPFVARN